MGGCCLLVELHWEGSGIVKNKNFFKLTKMQPIRIFFSANIIYSLLALLALFALFALLGLIALLVLLVLLISFIEA